MIMNNMLPEGAKELSISGQLCAIYKNGDEGNYQLCLAIKEDGTWSDLKSFPILKTRTRTIKEIEVEFHMNTSIFTSTVDEYIEKEPVSRIDHVQWLIDNKV